MKMHTFFLSGKAIAIVSGAFGACGMLLFVSGILVGVRVGASRPVSPAASTASADAAAKVAAVRATVAPSAAPTATAGHAASAEAQSPAIASTEQPSAPANAAWPFAASSYAPALQPSPTQTAPAIDSTVTAPAPAPLPQATPRAPVRRGMAAGQISMVAYVPDNTAGDLATVETIATPPSRAKDDAAYLVQVGTFRVEEHARQLADRLTRAGYRASITVRQEGDRSLHVVRVGRFTGVNAAEKVAAKIGGSEQLVASIVAARD